LLRFAPYCRGWSICANPQTTGGLGVDLYRCSATLGSISTMWTMTQMVSFEMWKSLGDTQIGWAWDVLLFENLEWYFNVLIEAIWNLS
jgi:hypothetical protein